VESAPVVTPAAEPVPVVTPVAETAPVATPAVEDVQTASSATVVKKSSAEGKARSHATAPMTRAPAPDYVPEAPRQSEWVRPSFDFDGKGAAGGHSATHHASAGPTRPQAAE